MNRRALVFMLTTLTASLTASGVPDRQETINRLQQAVSKANIFELPSFVMKATVHIENQGKSIDGIYQFLWNGPEQWREEIFVPGYQEIKIGGKGTISSQRRTDHLPLRIYNLHEALGFGSEGTGARTLNSSSLVQLDLRDSDTIKKAGERKVHGDHLACWEIVDTFQTATEVCISGTQGTLVRGSVFVDKNFQPVGSKIFPRSLSFQEDEKTAATVSVTELKSPAEFGTGAFQLPAGASIHPGCMNPTPFRIIKRTTPQYRDEARMLDAQGVIAADVAIGIDGVPRIGSLVESSSSDLADAPTRAIKQWRYAPALCSGQPVEVETVLQVGYTLSYHRR